MKITRKQLRRLIKESILNEMPFIKPGGEIALDDEGYGKLTDLSLSPDEMNQGMADDLAMSMGTIPILYITKKLYILITYFFI